MTITLGYSSTLSNVTISANVLGSDCNWALVERLNANGTTYDQVRGGAEWAVSGSAFTDTLNDFEFEPNVTNTYRVTPYDATNFPQDTPLTGLILDGTSGDYASTPDAASLDITGDIELMAEITPRDWTPSADQTLVSKYNTTGNQRSYMLQLRSTGALGLSWSSDGTSGGVLSATSNVLTTQIPSSGRLAVRATLDVNDGAGNRVIKFYTATSLSGTWTQLGSTVTTAGTTSIFSGTATGGIGARDAGTAERFAGVVHAAKIISGLAGTEVANPNFETQSNGATSFNDTATPAKTWTINGAAEVRVKQTNTTSPSIGSSIWLKSPTRPFLNRAVRVVGLSEITRPSRAGVFEIVGRSYPVAVTELRSSRRFSVTLRTTTNDLAEEMDLILAAGDTMMFHVPPDTSHFWLPPKIYVSIADASSVRLGIKTATDMDFTLSCIEVAQPDPDMAAATTTWAAILASYADWAALIAAFADWAAVLDDIAEAADVIVP